MKTVHISASRDYDIHIGSGCLSDPEQYSAPFEKVRSVMIVSDDTVFSLYGERVSDAFRKAGFRTESFVFPHGEQSKNIGVYGELLEYMCGAMMTRSDMIAALGGGVTGDMAGFAAATYQRGIRFIQMPTTLLAAVDASVGGKTAIDLKSGKNLCGCFYQPSLVLCDTDTFKTLPEREYRCGCAEIIKYAMLDGEDFLEQLIRVPVYENYEDVVEKCVRIKSRFVMEDEFDTGKRMLLNLGHTFGHAIEACSNYSILHGEAVAMGMAAVTKASVKRGICDGRTLDLLLEALESCGLETEVPFTADELAGSAMLDKKASGDSLNIVVPESAGFCRTEKISKNDVHGWMKDGGIQ